MYINCRGGLMDLSRPKVMGILNLTPDSFYAPSRVGKDEILYRAEKMLRDGADILDLGAYSSRPGADFVSEEEEKQRLLPALETLISHFPSVRISVDTFRAAVAEEAIQTGACMINDISGGQADNAMFDIISRYQVPYVLMHMRGTPQTMQNLTDYKPGVITEINRFFSKQIRTLHEKQVNDIILDPGFGFAKTMEQNYFILKHLDRFLIHNKPLLVGMSRKSMIYKLLNKKPSDVLHASVALHAIALLKGASIVRVHDPGIMKEVVRVTEEIM